MHLSRTPLAAISVATVLAVAGCDTGDGKTLRPPPPTTTSAPPVVADGDITTPTDPTSEPGPKPVDPNEQDTDGTDGG